MRAEGRYPASPITLQAAEPVRTTDAGTGREGMRWGRAAEGRQTKKEQGFRLAALVPRPSLRALQPTTVNRARQQRGTAPEGLPPKTQTAKPLTPIQSPMSLLYLKSLSTPRPAVIILCNCRPTFLLMGLLGGVHLRGLWRLATGLAGSGPCLRRTLVAAIGDDPETTCHLRPGKVHSAHPTPRPPRKTRSPCASLAIFCRF